MTLRCVAVVTRVVPTHQQYGELFHPSRHVHARRVRRAAAVARRFRQHAPHLRRAPPTPPPRLLGASPRWLRWVAKSSSSAASGWRPWPAARWTSSALRRRRLLAMSAPPPPPTWTLPLPPRAPPSRAGGAPAAPTAPQCCAASQPACATARPSSPCSSRATAASPSTKQSGTWTTSPPASRHATRARCRASRLRAQTRR